MHTKILENINVLRSKMFGVLAALLFMISLGTTQNLIFELKDRQYHEIIFRGDVRVAVICKLTNLTTAEIQITINGEIVANNARQGNCLEFTISRIDGDENINLTCSASYNTTGHVIPVTKTKTLILNVSDVDLSCFRNGTGINQPYQVGEVLLLSCYCFENVTCTWIKTEIGSGEGSVIETIENIIYNNKTIIRIIVDTYNDSNGANITNIRYDCFHGSSSTERCSIGPLEKSSGDFVLNPTTSTEISLECPVSEVFTDRSIPSRGKEVISATTGGPRTSKKHSAVSTFTVDLNNTYFLEEEFVSSSFSISQSSTKTTKVMFGPKNSSITDDMDRSIVVLIIALAVVFLLIILSFLSIVFLLRARGNKRKLASKDKAEVEETVTPNEKVDTHGVDETDDALGLCENGNISHVEIGVARLFDNMSHKKLHVMGEQLSTMQNLGDGLCANESRNSRNKDRCNYGDDEEDIDDEDEFQTADTSDYAIPAAILKNNVQNELGEVVAKNEIC